MSKRPGPYGQRIAAELRAELGRTNMSRRQLADRIGQSHVNVSRWLNGDGGINLENLEALCHGLGISVVELMTRVESDDDSAASVGPVPAPRRGGQVRRKAPTPV